MLNRDSLLKELDATQQELEDLRMTLRRADSENKAKAIEIEQVSDDVDVVIAAWHRYAFYCYGVYDGGSVSNSQ